MSTRTLSRPIVRLALFGVLSLFILAPTPGNVGGCSNSAGSNPVQPGDLNIGETSEYMYFDQSLCAYTCLQLRSCGQLCGALDLTCDTGADPTHVCTNRAQCCFGDCTNGHCPACDNNGEMEYGYCVRGNLNSDYLALGQCPHACPGGTHYRQAYEYDVEACGDAILNYACGSVTRDSNNRVTSRSGIYSVFASPPSECTNVCAPN